jgi:hypothetical protein
MTDGSQQAMTTNKGGAPIGNGNAVRHGLTTGKLPKGGAYIHRITNQFRAAVEAAVIDAKGEVSLIDAASIVTAVRWERHALLAQRWLRQEAATLTPDQRLSFSRDVARASGERDKCLRALGLDRDKQSTLIDALYAVDAIDHEAASDEPVSDDSEPNGDDTEPTTEDAT